MPWIAGVVAGVGALGGGLASGSAAKSAAQTSAQAQRDAAQIAAEEARFRPIGITSRFGASQFTVDPYTGRLTGAGYTVAPEIKTLQDQVIAQALGSGAGMAAQGTEAAQGLFGLGQKYLATSPEAAAQDWLSKQQALLQPSRDQAYAQMRQGLFNTGRAGLAMSQGGSLQAANPEAAAYYNALAQQDAQLAAQAMEQGRAQTTFGAGLFGTGAQLAAAGYSPLQTQIGLAQTMEQLGQSPLDIGAQLGGRSATAGAQVGNALLQGGMSAAKTLQAANSYSPVGATLTGLSQNPYLMQGIRSYFNPQAQTDTSASQFASYGQSPYTSNYNPAPSSYSSGAGSSNLFDWGSMNASYSGQ